MFKIFRTRSAAPAYSSISGHAEMAAEFAADVAYGPGEFEALASMAARHAACSDKCQEYVNAEIERRKAWGH